MIGLRKLFSVFGRGTLRFLNPANRKVLAYLRQQCDESVLCVANLSRFAQPVSLDLAEYEGRTPTEVFGYSAFPPITGQPYMLSLAPYSFLWFELQSTVRATSPDENGQAGANDHSNTDALALSEKEQTKLDQIHAPTPHSPADSRAEAEFLDGADSQLLLLHADPGTSQDLHQFVVTLARSMTEIPAELGIVLAYPVHDGEGKMPVLDEELRYSAPHLQLAPYRPLITLPQSWPYVPSFYRELAHLAEQHNANAVIQLHPESDPLPWPCILALANPVLRDGVGLSVARYQLSRYRGLLNSATLRPLTRALYCAEICYPLAPDAAYSREISATFVVSGPSKQPCVA